MDYFHTPLNFLDGFIRVAPADFVQPMHFKPYLPVTFIVEVRGNRELSLRTFKEAVLRFIGSNKVIIAWVEPEEVTAKNTHFFSCSINVIDEDM